MPTFHLYTLLCTDETKYFVGISEQDNIPISYFNKKHEDCSYLRDYEMNEIVSHECIEVDGKVDDSKVDSKVLELMQEHGALNVRGGSYMKLSGDIVAHLLTLPMFRQKKRCLFCLSVSHTSSKCMTYNSDDDSDYVPDEDDEEDEEDDDEDYEDEDSSV